jgi:hypothetical protein
MGVEIVVNPISGTRGRRRDHGRSRVQPARRLLDEARLPGSVSVTVRVRPGALRVRVPRQPPAVA